MKLNIKTLALVAVAAFSLSSCSDFLEKPTEDAYNVDNYYQTDDQCIAGVNYLYNSPWYDFQRGFIKVGEVLSGNYYWGSSPYLTFTVNGSDEDLVNMSYSLWAVIGHANTVYNSLSKSPASQSVVNQCKGECLLWKAMAYFFLVRSFGEVPIIHDTSETLTSGEYSNLQKVKRADVYEYIIMTLEKAMEYLPKEPATGRVGYYSAEGLLAKVYLTKAGISGSLSQSDLDMAAKYAKDVIDNYGGKLEANYGDIFRLSNRYTSEGLIVWRWTASGSNWTRQNTLQADLAISGFDSWTAWGGWNGFSVDMQQAFGIDLTVDQPDKWLNNVDTRLKATMMLPGFKYDQFFQADGGFDYLKFIYEQSTTGSLESATGCNTVKHLHGTTADHEAECGESDGRMASTVPTFLLRLSDVYLVYAEAKLGASRNATPDADALAAYNAVRSRAIPTASLVTTYTWEDVWKQRRLEFAMEGDRWYDYVRVSYYDPDFCVNELQNQKRNPLWNLDAAYKNYYETGQWDTMDIMYDNVTAAPNVASMMKKDPDSGKNYFFLPMTADDILYNPNFASSVDGVHVDVRETYSY